MIAIIDYGAGNLRSIRRALEAAGAVAAITDDPEEVIAADAVVLPGVGNAGHAMSRLNEMGMTDAIRRAVEDGKPFLGICVGMQLLFENQEEGNAQGIGLLSGRVRSLSGVEKVPHIGWNRSVPAGAQPGSERTDGPYYYFVHSYIAEPGDTADVVATVDYGESFPSIVHRGPVWGTQFHPEKSGADGLAFIQAWVDEIASNADRGSTSGP